MDNSSGMHSIRRIANLVKKLSGLFEHENEKSKRNINQNCKTRTEIDEKKKIREKRIVCHLC